MNFRGVNFWPKIWPGLTNIWVSFELLAHEQSNIGNDCGTRNWRWLAKCLVKAEEDGDWKRTPVTIVRSIWNWLGKRFANPVNFSFDNRCRYLIARAPTAQMRLKCWSNRVKFGQIFGQKFTPQNFARNPIGLFNFWYVQPFIPHPPKKIVLRLPFFQIQL